MSPEKYRPIANQTEPHEQGWLVNDLAEMELLARLLQNMPSLPEKVETPVIKTDEPIHGNPHLNRHAVDPGGRQMPPPTWAPAVLVPQQKPNHTL